MPDTATHPTDAAIEAFAVGRIDPTGHVAVEEHRANCDLCLERVESVALPRAGVGAREEMIVG